MEGYCIHGFPHYTSSGSPVTCAQCVGPEEFEKAKRADARRMEAWILEHGSLWQQVKIRVRRAVKVLNT